MTKVFLSYSSEDKEYVKIAAKKLGRARIVFDEMTFEPGSDFRDEIYRRLDEATHFVFFASGKSLASTWCRFELREAELKKIHGKLSGALCIIIDPAISFNNLPRWLQSTKATLQTRPSQAGRDIQHLVFSTLAPLQQKPFVGREGLLQEFSQTITDI